MQFPHNAKKYSQIELFDELITFHTHKLSHQSFNLVCAYQ